MAFNPNVNDIIKVNGIGFRFSEHPVSKDIPYGQTGRMGTVYQLVNTGNERDRRALKVVTQKFRDPALVTVSERIGKLANLPGLTVSIPSPKNT